MTPIRLSRVVCFGLSVIVRVAASAPAAIPSSSLLETVSLPCSLEATDENSPAGTSPPQREPESFPELLKALEERKEKELRTTLERLEGYTVKLRLDNEQIDRVLESLRLIEEKDTYQEMQWHGKVSPTLENAKIEYVNRQWARDAALYLGFHKAANHLRSLPLDQRVDGILDYIEQRVPVAGGAKSTASSWFQGELRRIGNDAVPTVLRRAEANPGFRFHYVDVLAQFGDERGVDFALRVLRELDQRDDGRRCMVIENLRSFRDPRVVEALVEQMHDDNVYIADIRVELQMPVAPSLELPVECFAIRGCVAHSLTWITGKDWGLLFNEDPLTWDAWKEAADEESFHPTNISRTDDELTELIRNYLHRCMRERMVCVTWNDNLQDGRFKVIAAVEDVRKLGVRVVPILVREYHSIVAEFPVWECDLLTWTQRLLLALDFPEATVAAAMLGDG